MDNMQRFMPIPFPPELEDGPDAEIHYRAKYHQMDWAHRHRLHDAQPKEVTVEAHTRRKPAKP